MLASLLASDARCALNPGTAVPTSTNLPAVPICLVFIFFAPSLSLFFLVPSEEIHSSQTAPHSLYPGTNKRRCSLLFEFTEVSCRMGGGGGACRAIPCHHAMPCHAAATFARLRLPRICGLYLGFLLFGDGIGLTWESIHPLPWKVETKQTRQTTRIIIHSVQQSALLLLLPPPWYSSIYI